MAHKNCQLVYCSPIVTKLPFHSFHPKFPLDTVPGLALHKGGYATPKGMGAIMDASEDFPGSFFPVTLLATDTDGNAFHLLGAFAAKAREQGWSEEAIATVQRQAMAGDYDHLVRTLAQNTEPPHEAE